MSKKIWGLPVSTPLNPAKIDPVVPDDKLANAVSAYMDANPVTPSGIGARPDTWTPTAAEVGATPASHAEDKNNPHSVTIEQIGAAPATHAEDKLNPHGVTAAQVGLGNVNNTADKDKPVSTAQATAIADAKKAGTDAQTAASNAHTAANNAQTAATNAHTAIADHIADKNNPHEVTAAQVGATSMTLLWENASPTSEFVEQDISVPVAQYDMIMIEHIDSTNWAGTVMGFGRNGYYSIVNDKEAQRACMVEADKVHFYPGEHNNATNNKQYVPIRIYGIKGVIE